MAKKGVDGVYDSDPRINSDAVKFDTLEYIDVLNRGLGVMDSTATSLCMDNGIPIIVFNFNEENSIVRIIRGESLGTIIGGRNNG
jgi:uridylate kinase